MMSRPVAALGTELRLWCCCYMGYLLVFLHPQTSTFRMLLPLFPLALSAALVSRSRAYRGTVVADVPPAADRLDRLAVGLGAAARRRRLSAVTHSTFPRRRRRNPTRPEKSID